MAFLSELSIGMLLLEFGICTRKQQTRPPSQYIYAVFSNLFTKLCFFRYIGAFRSHLPLQRARLSLSMLYDLFALVD